MRILHFVKKQEILSKAAQIPPLFNFVKGCLSREAENSPDLFVPVSQRNVFRQLYRLGYFGNIGCANSR